MKKINSNTVYFKDGKLKIKYRKLDENKFLFWICINNINIAFVMLMSDFMEWCSNELDVNIKPDKSWNNHIGFNVKDINPEVFIIEVKRFIKKYNITPNKYSERFIKEEWETNFIS